jgi:NAD(P)H dehydrogenase (quinone)
LVTADDFREAGAIVFGTPTRFGNVSAQLKNQIDQLTSLWLKGELEGKPAGVFVSTASSHGGQETTALTLMGANEVSSSSANDHEQVKGACRWHFAKM